MDNKKLYTLAEETERSIARELEAMNSYIFKHPELGGEEHLACEYLTAYLKDKGFTLTYPLGSQATGFRADFGDADGPRITFLAEYDALPGYAPDGGAGHACGHNWIAAHSCGTAVVLSMMKEHFHGSVSVIGAPAEETYGGKVIAAREGFYNDIDVAIQAHPAPFPLFMDELLAISSYKFIFHGKAAHAASLPWKGINALDAVIETFVGVNALRQHLKPDARIHGIIPDGGKAPNVVPDYASAYFMVRASHRAYLDEVCDKVKAIADGAARMTGASLEIQEPDLPFNNMLKTPTVRALAVEHMERLGIVPGDIPFSGGSSDVGDVSYICPSIIIGAGIQDDGAPFMPHEAATMYMADSPAAYRALHEYINVAVGMALDLYGNTDLISKAKAEVALGRKEK